MTCEKCMYRVKTVNTLLHYTGEEEKSTPYQCRLGRAYCEVRDRTAGHKTITQRKISDWKD